MVYVDNNIELILSDVEGISLSLDTAIKKVEPPLENLEATPTKEQQVFNHENSYGYDNVTVNPIPDEYIIPDGVLPITENKTYDVTRFARVSAAVYPAPNLQDKNIEITENGTQTVTADTGYDGLGNVNITTNAIEDLETELAEQDNSINAQKDTIFNIIDALKGKAVGKPDIEANYVQDGLIAWWDGADEPDENGNWLSRIGDDYISQYTTILGDSTTHKFGILHSPSEKCYKNNAMYGLTTQKDYWNRYYTIEVVGKTLSTANSGQFNASDAGPTFFAFNKGSSPMIAIMGKNGAFIAINSSRITHNVVYDNLHFKRVTMTINLTTIPTGRNDAGAHMISYSINGKNWATTQEYVLGTTTSRANNCAIMGYYQNSTLGCCEINSIRIYNRKLTAAELAHNHEEDTKRFDMDEYNG